jgi:hypothetical protein
MRNNIPDLPVPLTPFANVVVILTIYSLDLQALATEVTQHVWESVFVYVVRLPAFQAVLTDEAARATLHNEGLMLAAFRRHLAVEKP